MKHFIGIDIAKQKIDCCYYNGDLSSCVFDSFINNADGFFEFFSFITSISDIKNIRIGFEATSTYMIPLQKYLDSLKIKYILINPQKLHHYIKYKHKNSKTDKQDAFYIAEYITTLEDKAFNSSHSEIKQLMQSYHSFVKFLTKSETHLKALDDSIFSSQFTSSALLKEVQLFKSQVKSVRNKAIKEQINLVRSYIPEYDFIKSDLIGVSDMTLLSVLPLIYDNSEKYTLKQFQSFFGLNPVQFDSGKSVSKHQRISKAGKEQVRSLLYMSSLSSITYNEESREKYQTLLARGKPKKVALTAISAHILRAIIKKLNYYKNQGLGDYEKH